MSNTLNKILDIKYKAIYHIRIDGASPPAIDPKISLGAFVKLTVPTGGTNFVVGEQVSQGSGATLSTGEVISIEGDTVIGISTGRDSVAVFDLSVALVGATSGASKIPSANTSPTQQRFGITKLAWSNFLGATKAVEFLWDAATDERIITVANGRGIFEMPGAVIEQGVITGQTGIINTSLPVAFTSPDFASILIEVSKTQGFIYTTN